MKMINVYSAKAEKYAKYRWTYAPKAIQTIFNQTGINAHSCVADIGAGTGILTREFIGKVKQIFAIEPDPVMRAIAARDLGQYPSCQVINGRAEATTLASQSIDLVTAAQAVHWFEPEAARREFYRILKPGGWLTICRNYGTDRELGEALAEVYPPENDTEALMVGKSQPKSFYFHGDDYLKVEFPAKSQLTWEAFFGALSTASFAPDETSALFAQFRQAARRVFDRFRAGDRIEMHYSTELYLGQISGV